MSSSADKVRALMVERGWSEATALELLCRFIRSESFDVGGGEAPLEQRLERFLGDVILKDEKMGKDD